MAISFRYVISLAFVTAIGICSGHGCKIVLITGQPFLNAADTFWHTKLNLRPLIGTMFALSLGAWNICMDKML